MHCTILEECQATHFEKVLNIEILSAAAEMYASPNSLMFLSTKTMTKYRHQ